MKIFLSSKKKTVILAAAMSFTFGNSVFASDTDYLYYNGEKFAEFEFFNEGEFSAQYTLSDALRNAVKSSTSYWSGIIAPRSKYSSSWQIMVATRANFQNADALTYSFSNNESVNDNYVLQMLQSRKNLNSVNVKLLAENQIDADIYDAEAFTDEIKNSIKEIISDGDYSVSMINIGQYLGANRNDAIDGWWIDNDTVLPTNEQAADFVGCFRHELGHALGIELISERSDWDGNIIEPDEDPVTYGENKFIVMKIPEDLTGKNFWTFHLTDKNGNYAKPGMMILSTEGFNILKEKNPAAVESDYFIVDKDNFAYFVGDNVTEVLDGATFNGISGLPVNGWEKDEDGLIFEGSHLQTAGMMSHRSYTNYTSFMEVELAAMQDLGYDIDRKAYFGYSIYGNGGTITNTQGFFARNEDGTAYTSDYSQVPLGIGLHIYGANNNVTQAANILTRGTGAVGVRIDGEGNTLNIPENTEIHADGLRGKGVLISYGRKQNLNLEGTVTATGEGGNAVEFNFGSSSNGAFDDYRGSYIRYRRRVDELTGSITSAKNLTLNDMDNDTYNSSEDELNGEQVTDFNISGKITGGENAIYIGKNALVKNINVNSGAEINGNIISDWKHFSEDDGIFSESDSTEINPLKLQYNGGEYVYNKYIPDLVTNLNFNSTMAYSGNISGADNIKLNVTGNNLIYGGAADVINVNVAQGAGLFGGTYTVNDMSANLAEGFNDDTTGKFYNHGTISGVEINGDLISDGTLTDEAGKISVNGAANVDGSTVISKNVLPDETAEILAAQNNITGDLANTVDNPEKISGLLNGYGEISDNKITYTAKTANNIFNAVKNMSTALTNDDRKSELLAIYNLDSENAGRALSQIGNNDAAQLLSAAQQSTVANRVISDRLNTAFSSNVVNFNVGANNFADGEDENILMGVSANYNETAENNFWVKFTKNWGELKGGANYHGSAISGGYDRAFGENWRAGLFVSYNATSLASDNSGGSAYDTRGGLYGGYHNEVDDAFIYIDAGKVRNKLNRSISALGLGAEANGEYKRNLTPEKIWSVSPFVNLQYSRLKQKAYNETGAGIYNQQVNSKSNGYFAGTLGVEFKRVLANGSYAARIGVKHAFTGADPELNFSYEGNNNNFYTLKNNQDKTHFILSIGGENHFKGGWILGGDVGWQKGSHDKDLTASVMLRKVW